MEGLVLDAVDGTLASIPQAKRRDPALVRDAVKRAIRAAVEQVWGKRPIAKVLITVVDAKG
jgi:ribonuclease J